MGGRNGGWLGGTALPQSPCPFPPRPATLHRLWSAQSHSRFSTDVCLLGPPDAYRVVVRRGGQQARVGRVPRHAVDGAEVPLKRGKVLPCAALPHVNLRGWAREKAVQRALSTSVYPTVDTGVSVAGAVAGGGQGEWGGRDLGILKAGDDELLVRSTKARPHHKPAGEGAVAASGVLSHWILAKPRDVAAVKVGPNVPVMQDASVSWMDGQGGADPERSRDRRNGKGAGADGGPPALKSCRLRRCIA